MPSSYRTTGSTVIDSWNTTDDDVITLEDLGGVVIGLGELGRSTRLVNVAEGIALENPNKGYVLVGYYDEFPLNDLLPSNIIISQIRKYETSMLPGSVHVLMKTVALTFQFIRLLWYLPEAPWFYVQNPPSIPVLIAFMIVRMFGRFKNTEIVLDWHNLGSNITESNSPGFIRWLYAYMEATLGYHVPTHHFTVSCAMSNYLQDRLRLKRNMITVLYDQPNYPIDCSDDHKYKRLKEALVSTNPEKDRGWLDHQIIDGMICYTSWSSNKLKNKPIIISMGSSFTMDEGTQDLVLAMQKVDKELQKQKIDRYLCVVVTGEGPNVTAFKDLIRGFKWHHVNWFTGYLSFDDYWGILNISDIGLSIFYSSSGLDIPMKAYDLVGAKVPNNIYWDFGLPMIEFIEHVSQEESNYMSTKNNTDKDKFLWVPIQSNVELERRILDLVMQISEPRQLCTHENGQMVVYESGETFRQSVSRAYKLLLEKSSSKMKSD